MRFYASRLFRACCAQTFIVMALAVITTPASAQDSRYSSWNNPDGNTTSANQTRLGNMVNELNRLILDAEKARAADRLFLRDLKDLAQRYESQWTRRLMFDNFFDGNYTASPRWEIASGEFWVERNFGLRSRVSTTATSTTSTTTDKKQAQREAAQRLLGAILQQAITGSGGTVTTTPSRITPAVAQLPGTISNAFALNAEITSWNKQGQLELGVYQRGVVAAGYRVVYTPGDRPTLELHKVTSRGRTLVDRANTVRSLEDEKTHSLDLTRAKDGTMTVLLDGREVMRTRDVSFSDPFGGVLFANAGSDVILHNVTVMGTN